MPATFRSTALRRHLAVAAALPLLAITAAACGYGSEADEDTADKAAPAANAKKLSADTVKIGYFPNLTHATALIGDHRGLFQKELGGTKVSYSQFNAGPSEIEALNSGSIDIGWIGPSPRSTATPSPTVRTCASSAVRPPAG